MLFVIVKVNWASPFPAAAIVAVANLVGEAEVKPIFSQPSPGLVIVTWVTVLLVPPVAPTFIVIFIPLFLNKLSLDVVPSNTTGIPLPPVPG